MITPTWDRQGQSRALPTPIWRLGVQCKEPIRDSADLQRWRWRTLRLGQAAWGWRPELPTGPTAGVAVQAAAEGRRTEGVNPLAPGSQCVDGGPLQWSESAVSLSIA